MSKTSFVEPKLKDLPMSEVDPDFDISAAPAPVRSAIERAQKASGVVEVGKNFEQNATPQQREARRLESMRKEAKTDKKLLGRLDRKIKARYKIELIFDQGRTTMGPNRVAISLWESGKLFNGGGDESMFFCKDGTVENGQGCWSPIPNSQVRSGVAYCNTCKMAINSDKLTLQKKGMVPTRVLSAEVVKIFGQLESNADIYVKFHKDDPHYIAMLRARGEAVAERLKGMHIYPLANILTDTAAGASLEKRFFAFLTS